jgi:hypothetical protein
MGMFDHLICEMPLPAQPRPPRSHRFQTKDTEPQFLERFTINADGRLIHHTVRYEEVPRAELPYPDMPFIGAMREIPTGNVDTNFHGYLKFHTYDGETREWWRYEAKFTDGQCVEIACVEYERQQR